MQRKLMGIISLATLALTGCPPSAFEELDDRARGDGGDFRDAQADAQLEGDASGSGDANADAGGDANDDIPEPEGDAGTDPGSDCPAPPEVPRALKVSSPFVELARLSSPPQVVSRPLSATAWLSTDRVWVFSSTRPGDSALARPAGTPFNYPSAATESSNRPWTRDAPSATPWTLKEQVDDAGLPSPLVTIPEEEVNSFANMIPGSVIRHPSVPTRGLIFLRKSYWLNPVREVWLADIEAGSTQGKLHAQPLFSGNDPPFSMGAHRGTTYVKVFACLQQPSEDGSPATYPCMLARAPVAQVTERAAYEARVQRADGSWDWDKDLTLATPVLNAIEGELSVSYNNYLGQFVAVHSVFFSDEVVFQTARSVDGPWSEAARITLPKASISWPNSSAREQPGLAQRCGKRLIITYWSPTHIPDTEPRFPDQGEVVMGAVDLD